MSNSSRHPYSDFEDTPLWLAIEQALADLEVNRDLEVTTNRTHVIGYLCQQLTNRDFVTDAAIAKAELP